ncbi:MAG TPA: uroporphyrinogen decarboxylase family protein [Armatimonadota bacterium]|jgi:hypothetical protein
MPTHLTSRERLERVLRGQPTDRVPIRLWWVDPLAPAPRPEWQFLHDMVYDLGLDVFFSWFGEQSSPAVAIVKETREILNSEWFEEVTTYQTPAGEISSIFMRNYLGKPGYEKKYLIESVEDAKRWLSLPEDDLPGVATFPARRAQAGDRGMVFAAIDEPMGRVNLLMGSELWGIWLYDERDLLHELVAKAARRDYAVAKHFVEQGVGPLFGWVGPEVCIPPLASPRDFDEFVTQYDKPIIDLIHNAGGLVWVHCHGDMDPVLERFADMGVDCLNPLEPPPIGRLTLADAKRRVGNRMTLEGGFEVGDLELNTPEEITATVAEIMEMGKPGGRYIMCPSSDHTHWPDMNAHITENYRVFIETSLQLAEY